MRGREGGTYKAVNLSIISRLDVRADVLHVVLADCVELVVGPVVVLGIHLVAEDLGLARASELVLDVTEAGEDAARRVRVRDFLAELCSVCLACFSCARERSE